MQGTPIGGLGIIAAAVTPVVMISAVALLIVGIHNRYAMLIGRIRGLAAEARHHGTTPERRANIQGQFRVLSRRFRYTTLAQQFLYVATLCFIATVFAIGLAVRLGISDYLALAVFLVGIVLTFGAIAAEWIEVRLACETLRSELEDVLPSEAPAEPGSGMPRRRRVTP